MKTLFVCLLTWLTAAPALADSTLTHELALAESWLAAQRAYDQVPGLSAAIVRDQEILWSGASGHADLDDLRPARDDTIYGICSISKLFTGIAVMQLRDQGKVRLDDPLEKLLPWYNLDQSFEDHGIKPLPMMHILLVRCRLIAADSLQTRDGLIEAGLENLLGISLVFAPNVCQPRQGVFRVSFPFAVLQFVPIFRDGVFPQPL